MSAVAVGMHRARSVTGPLRRAHPASGATWNVQVVRGKMSSKCLWHACRALSAGLLLMLLGAAMAVIGYYADMLSVDQEIRGNATVSVKDEARGFHLNNLSYAGPIVMGFGGFIVVAACVMTFEARDSAAKVTPARPTAMPRPIPRRGPQCAAPARLDQLGVYRLPHMLPLPHILPIAPMRRHRPLQPRITGERVKGARFGSAPDLRSAGGRPTLPVAALRRPLRRYALSVDEPPQSAVSASAAESECGSQSSLAMDLHASGACAGVTLRVRDNTRRRPLARQQRLRDDTVLPTPIGSTGNLNAEEILKTPGENSDIVDNRLSVVSDLRASSAPPPATRSPQPSPPPSPRLIVTSPFEPDQTATSITILIEEKQTKTQDKEETEKQNSSAEKEHVLPEKRMVLDMEGDKMLEKDSDKYLGTVQTGDCLDEIVSESPPIVYEQLDIDEYGVTNLMQELKSVIEEHKDLPMPGQYNMDIEPKLQGKTVLSDIEDIHFEQNTETLGEEISEYTNNTEEGTDIKQEDITAIHDDSSDENSPRLAMY